MKTETAERELSERLCRIESLFFPCKGVEIEVEIREDFRGKCNVFSKQINFVLRLLIQQCHNDTCAIFVKICFFKVFTCTYTCIFLQSCIF